MIKVLNGVEQALTPANADGARAEYAEPSTVEARFHREPDCDLDTLRATLGETARKELPKAFFRHMLKTFALGKEMDGFVFVSDDLEVGVPVGGKKSESVALPLTVFQSLLHRLRLTKYSGGGPSSFDEASDAVRAAWDAQRKDTPFDDTVYVVLLSPYDPDDYIALGGRRIYWLDDDVQTKTHHNGQVR